MAETGGEEVEEEETSEESGEDEEEDDDEDGGEERHRSDSRRVKHHKISRNGTEDGIRKQRRAAKKANYSFKEYDDMIKSALRVNHHTFYCYIYLFGKNYFFSFKG